MSNTLVIADLHIGFQRSETILESRRLDKLYNFLTSIKQEYEYDTVILLGDYARGTKKLTYNGIHRINSTIKWLDAYTTYIIAGNHDISTDGTFIHTLELEGMSIRKIPLSIPIDDRLSIFIPYDMAEEEIKIYLDKQIEKYKDIPIYVFGHLGIQGGRTGSDFILEGGINPHIFDHPQIKKVYLGHYHARQTIGKITYVGSPWQITFGEEQDKKYVLLLDDDMNETWIETPCADLKTMMAKEILEGKEVDKELFYRIIYTEDDEKEKIEKNFNLNIMKWVRQIEDKKINISEIDTEEFITSPEKVLDTFIKDNDVKDVEMGKAILKKVL